MPNIKVAAITITLFFYDSTICPKPSASAAGNIQTIAAVGTEHFTTKQSMRTVRICVLTLFSAAGIPQFLSFFKYFRLDDPQLRAFFFNVAIDKITRVSFVTNHPANRNIRDVLSIAPHNIVFDKIVADSFCAVSLINILLKDQAHHGGFFLVDFQIADSLVLFVQAAFLDTLVTKSYNAASVVTFFRKLFYTGASTDRGLDALAGCLPVADIVHQLIDMGIKTLLTFIYAPDLDPLLREPFHDKGRFVVTPTQTVKHEHQQNIKLSGSSRLLKQLELIAVFCRFLKTGNAFFGKLLDDFPALPFCKFVAGFFLHGYVILFDLSNGRNTV